MDYERINKFFDFLEPVMLAEAGKRQLTSVDAARWRWDNPELTVTWKTNGIDRNIVALVEGDRVKIEVNASKDTEKRHYTHKPIAVIDLSELATIKTMIKLSFDTVLELTERNLTLEGN